MIVATLLDKMSKQSIVFSILLLVSITSSYYIQQQSNQAQLDSNIFFNENDIENVKDKSNCKEYEILEIRKVKREASNGTEENETENESNDYEKDRKTKEEEDKELGDDADKSEEAKEKKTEDDSEKEDKEEEDKADEGKSDKKKCKEGEDCKNKNSEESGDDESNTSDIGEDEKTKNEKGNYQVEETTDDVQAEEEVPREQATKRKSKSEHSGSNALANRRVALAFGGTDDGPGFEQGFGFEAPPFKLDQESEEEY